MGLKPMREARTEVIPVEGRVEAIGEELESDSHAHSHMWGWNSSLSLPSQSAPVCISTTGNHYLPSPLLWPSQQLDC